MDFETLSLKSENPPETNGFLIEAIILSLASRNSNGPSLRLSDPLSLDFSSQSFLKKNFRSIKNSFSNSMCQHRIGIEPLLKTLFQDGKFSVKSQRKQNQFSLERFMTVSNSFR